MVKTPTTTTEKVNYRYRSRSAFISGSNTRVNGVFFYDRPIYWKIPPSFFFFFFSFFCCCVTSNGTPHTNSHKIVLEWNQKENDWRKRCYQVVGWAHLLKRRRRRRRNETNKWERPARVLMSDLLSEARQSEAKGASILYASVCCVWSGARFDPSKTVWIRLTRWQRASQSGEWIIYLKKGFGGRNVGIDAGKERGGQGRHAGRQAGRDVNGRRLMSATQKT